MIRVPYISIPAALAGELLVTYATNRATPARHFRCKPQTLPIVTDLLVDRHPLDLSDDHPLWRIPGVAIYELPKMRIPAVDVAIIDLSIGGPSLWASDVADTLIEAGRSVIFISQFCKVAAINGEALPPFPWASRTAFSHLTRCMVRLAHARQLLLIGREMGARMLDLMDRTPTTILETGFAESCLPGPEVPKEILELALKEVLLREDSFPWDNVSHAILASEAIRRARCNVTWSHVVAGLIQEKYPLSRVVCQSPSIRSERFPYTEITTSDPLRVAFGGGAHTLGPRGREFLAADDVVKAVSMCKGAELTLLTSDPHRLRSHFSGISRVTIRPRLERQEMPAFMRGHQVYFRLQNDHSLPLSCVEAMSMGRVVILNERARDACDWLRHMDNCILVPFGNAEFLVSVFGILRSDKDLVRRIGSHARSAIEKHCSLSSAIEELGLLSQAEDQLRESEPTKGKS